MWKTRQALEERTEYAQITDTCWRATYRGFITVFSDGASPRVCGANLAETFDAILANFVRSSRPAVKPDPPAAGAEEPTHAQTNNAPGRQNHAESGRKRQAVAASEAAHKAQRRR